MVDHDGEPALKLAGEIDLETVSAYERIPSPVVEIESPIPPRTTQPSAMLYQNATFGTRAECPATGALPVGVSTVSSAVSERSCVS